MQSRRVLHYVESSTRVGRVLIVMSRSGVVDIVLAEHAAAPGSPVCCLQSRFPDAMLVPDDGSHGSWAAAVVARIDRARGDLVAPIDLTRTARPAFAAAPGLRAPALQTAVESRFVSARAS